MKSDAAFTDLNALHHSRKRDRRSTRGFAPDLFITEPRQDISRIVVSVRDLGARTAVK